MSAVQQLNSYDIKKLPRSNFFAGDWELIRKTKECNKISGCNLDLLRLNDYCAYITFLILEASTNGQPITAEEITKGISELQNIDVEFFRYATIALTILAEAKLIENDSYEDRTLILHSDSNGYYKENTISLLSKSKELLNL